MFSHIVTIYFIAKPEIVSNWLKASPGVNEAKQETLADGTTRYPLWNTTTGAAGVVYVSGSKTEVGLNLGSALDGPTVNSPIPPRH